jgi:hypothetical protein
MKRLFVILFCLVSSISYCQQVMTIRGTGPDGKTRNVAVTASGAIETAGSVSGVASISNDINALADQQASETLQILAAQASTTTKVTDVETGILALSAQQASESIDTLAAIATVTLDMASLSSDIGRVESETASGNVSINNSVQEVKTSVDTLAVQQASESSDILDAIASTTLDVGSVTSKIEKLRIQQASESIDNLAALATITNDIGSISSDIGRVETTLKPIGTPTRTEMVSDTVAAAITPTAGRIWIKVQNKSSTEEVTLDFVNTVTPGNGDTIYPGSHILLPVDASVPIYVISSSAAPISILEATR